MHLDAPALPKSAVMGGSGAIKAARISLGSTIIVVLFKLFAAWKSASVAVLAEAVQSVVDVAMSLGALWAVRYSAEPADDEHPYGHGKAELLVSSLQMVVVIVTSVFVTWQATLRFGNPHEIQPLWGIAALAYTVAANSVVGWHLRRTGTRLESAALLGEAQHLRSDTLASAGVLVGLVAYWLTGIEAIDPAVAITFTCAGAFMALRHLQELAHPLMDGALPADEIAKLERVLDDHPQARGFHNVRTRRSGRLRIVSLHVLLDDHLSFVLAHELAEQIEREVSGALGGALVTVHYEPAEAETAHRLAEH